MCIALVLAIFCPPSFLISPVSLEQRFRLGLQAVLHPLEKQKSGAPLLVIDTSLTGWLLTSSSRATLGHRSLSLVTWQTAPSLQLLPTSNLTLAPNAPLSYISLLSLRYSSGWALIHPLFCDGCMLHPSYFSLSTPLPNVLFKII